MTGRRSELRRAWTRIAVWVVTAAVGAYLVVTGILGIIAKG